MTTSESRPQSPRIQVEVSPREQRVVAGQRVILSLAVGNRSPGAQEQAVTIDGLPEGWAAVVFDQRRKAFPGERRTGTIELAPPQDAPVGRRRFYVVVRSGGDESSAECWAEVAAPEGRIEPAGVTLRPDTVVTQPGREERIAVVVRNPGTLESTYRVTVEGLEAGWFRAPAQVRVPAGLAIEQELWLAPPAGAAERDHEFTLRLVAEGSPDVRTEVSGILALRSAGRPGEPVRAPRGPVMSDPDTRTVPRDEAPMPGPPPVEPPDVFIAPASLVRLRPSELSTQAIITVQNRSRMDERYRVTVEQLPDGWFTLSTEDVRVERGASQQIALRLRPRPGPETPAGAYDFKIVIEPHGFPEAAGVIEARLVVEGRRSFDAHIEPPMARGRSAVYQVQLENTGTLSSAFAIEGRDVENRCAFQVESSPVVQPGLSAKIPVRVRAQRSRFVGSPETFDFRLSIRPAEDPPETAKQYSARFVHQPFVTPRVPALLAIYGLVGIVVLLAIVLLPDPVESRARWLGCKIHYGPECAAGAVAPTPTPTPTATVTATVTGTPVATDTATATTTPEALACTNGGGTSRVAALQIDVTAFADDRANVRDPAGGTRVAQVDLAGEGVAGGVPALASNRFTVVGGPECSGDLVWWQVRYAGDDAEVTGWIAELDGDGIVNLHVDEDALGKPVEE